MGRGERETGPIRTGRALYVALVASLIAAQLIALPSAAQLIDTIEIDIQADVVPHDEPIGDEPGQAEILVRVECSGTQIPGPATIQIWFFVETTRLGVEPRLEEEFLLLQYDVHDCAAGRTDEFNTTATIHVGPEYPPGQEIELHLRASQGGEPELIARWTETIGLVNDWKAVTTGFGGYVPLYSDPVGRLTVVNKGNVPVHVQVEEVKPPLHGTLDLPDHMTVKTSYGVENSQFAKTIYDPQSRGWEDVLLRLTAVHADDRSQKLGEQLVPLQFYVVEDATDYHDQLNSDMAVPVAGPEEPSSPWLQTITVIAVAIFLLVIWRNRFKNGSKKNVKTAGEPSASDPPAPAKAVRSPSTAALGSPGARPFHVKAARSPRK